MTAALALVPMLVVVQRLSVDTIVAEDEMFADGFQNSEASCILRSRRVLLRSMRAEIDEIDHGTMTTCEDAL